MAFEVKIENGELLIRLPLKRVSCDKCARSEVPVLRTDLGVILPEQLTQFPGVVSSLFKDPFPTELIFPASGPPVRLCPACAAPIVLAKQRGGEVITEAQNEILLALGRAVRP